MKKQVCECHEKEVCPTLGSVDVPCRCPKCKVVTTNYDLYGQSRLLANVGPIEVDVACEECGKWHVFEIRLSDSGQYYVSRHVDQAPQVED